MEEIKPGKYKHYKGKQYEVIGVSKRYDGAKDYGNKIFRFVCIAKHSETSEDLMVYKLIRCESNELENTLWHRPKNIPFNREKDKLEKLVIYKALYGSEKFRKNSWRGRPKKMFLETVNIDGKDVPRFKYVG